MHATQANWNLEQYWVDIFLDIIGFLVPTPVAWKGKNTHKYQPPQKDQNLLE